MSRAGRRSMDRRAFIFAVAAVGLSTTPAIRAQPRKPYHVGVIYEGGPYTAIVDGLSDGCRELGLDLGKDVFLELHDVHDRKVAGEAARALEDAKTDLLYTLGTSVTLAVKDTTTRIPVVFVSGGDAVGVGLARTLARPGGRFTGIQYLSVDLTAKRLEILREMLPKLHRVVTFYDPGNPVAGIKETRAAGRRLNIEIVERPVTSVAELKQSLEALGLRDADAYFYTPEAMVLGEARLVIDAARAKKLPTMFGELSLVTLGALASYGVNFYDVGRSSAKYVQRILTGTPPNDLAIESISRYGLGINLKTAQELGITVPQAVLLRADKVVE